MDCIVHGVAKSWTWLSDFNFHFHDSYWLRIQLEGRGTRDQIANICWIIEKSGEFKKNIFWFIDYARAFDCVDHKKTGKLLKRWEYQTTLPDSWEIYMQVKKQQLELDTEQQTDSKLGKEYIKTVYCHSAYLTYMQSTSCKMPGWMSTSWNQDCWEKYQ